MRLTKNQVKKEHSSGNCYAPILNGEHSKSKWRATLAENIKGLYPDRGGGHRSDQDGTMRDYAVRGFADGLVRPLRVLKMTIGTARA